MELINILGVHGKKLFLFFFFWGGGGGRARKTNIYGGLSKKGGLGQSAGLKGSLARKKGGGGVFEGRLIPECTLWSTEITKHKVYKS